MLTRSTSGKQCAGTVRQSLHEDLEKHGGPEEFIACTIEMNLKLGLCLKTLACLEGHIE